MRFPQRQRAPRYSVPGGRGCCRFRRHGDCHRRRGLDASTGPSGMGWGTCACVIDGWISSTTDSSGSCSGREGGRERPRERSARPLNIASSNRRWADAGRGDAREIRRLAHRHLLVLEQGEEVASLLVVPGEGIGERFLFPQRLALHASLAALSLYPLTVLAERDSSEMAGWLGRHEVRRRPYS